MFKSLWPSLWADEPDQPPQDGLDLNTTQIQVNTTSTEQSTSPLIHHSTAKLHSTHSTALSRTKSDSISGSQSFSQLGGNKFNDHLSNTSLAHHPQANLSNASIHADLGQHLINNNNSSLTMASQNEKTNPSPILQRAISSVNITSQNIHTDENLTPQMDYLPSQFTLHPPFQFNVNGRDNNGHKQSPLIIDLTNTPQLTTTPPQQSLESNIDSSTNNPSQQNHISAHNTTTSSSYQLISPSISDSSSSPHQVIFNTICSPLNKADVEADNTQQSIPTHPLSSTQSQIHLFSSTPSVPIPILPSIVQTTQLLNTLPTIPSQRELTILDDSVAFHFDSPPESRSVSRSSARSTSITASSFCLLSDQPGSATSSRHPQHPQPQQSLDSSLISTSQHDNGQNGFNSDYDVISFGETVATTDSHLLQSSTGLLQHDEYINQFHKYRTRVNPILPIIDPDFYTNQYPSNVSSNSSSLVTSHNDAAQIPIPLQISLPIPLPIMQPVLTHESHSPINSSLSHHSSSPHLSPVTAAVENNFGDFTSTTKSQNKLETPSCVVLPPPLSTLSSVVSSSSTTHSTSPNDLHLNNILPSTRTSTSSSSSRDPVNPPSSPPTLSTSSTMTTTTTSAMTAATTTATATATTTTTTATTQDDTNHKSDLDDTIDDLLGKCKYYVRFTIQTIISPALICYLAYQIYRAYTHPLHSTVFGIEQDQHPRLPSPNSYSTNNAGAMTIPFTTSPSPQPQLQQSTSIQYIYNIPSATRQLPHLYVSSRQNMVCQIARFAFTSVNSFSSPTPHHSLASTMQPLPSILSLNNIILTTSLSLCAMELTTLFIVLQYFASFLSPISPISPTAFHLALFSFAWYTTFLNWTLDVVSDP